MPDDVSGVLGSGGGGRGGGYDVAEASMHSNKGDCRVVADGQFLNGMKYLQEHPDGEPAMRS